MFIRMGPSCWVGAKILDFVLGIVSLLFNSASIKIPMSMRHLIDVHDTLIPPIGSSLRFNHIILQKFACLWDYKLLVLDNNDWHSSINHSSKINNESRGVYTWTFRSRLRVRCNFSMFSLLSKRDVFTVSLFDCTDVIWKKQT